MRSVISAMRPIRDYSTHPIYTRTSRLITASATRPPSQHRLLIPCALVVFSMDMHLTLMLDLEWGFMKPVMLLKDLFLKTLIYSKPFWVCSKRVCSQSTLSLKKGLYRDKMNLVKPSKSGFSNSEIYKNRRRAIQSISSNLLGRSQGLYVLNTSLEPRPESVNNSQGTLV